MYSRQDLNITWIDPSRDSRKVHEMEMVLHSSDSHSRNIRPRIRGASIFRLIHVYFNTKDQPPSHKATLQSGNKLTACVSRPQNFHTRVSIREFWLYMLHARAYPHPPRVGWFRFSIFMVAPRLWRDLFSWRRRDITEPHKRSLQSQLQGSSPQLRSCNWRTICARYL